MNIQDTYNARQKSLQEYWVKEMTRRGGYWLHDGNPRRPYALLTGNDISNFYANCAVIDRRSPLLKQAAQDLCALSRMLPGFEKPQAISGSAYGAIKLADRLAELLDAESWFTVKGADKSQTLDRFDFTPEVKTVALAEDVITTMGTTLSAIRELRGKAEPTGARVLPYVFALVNRTNKRVIDGFRIVALIEVNAPKWERGHNPFTPNGEELVEPVRPKQHWDRLVAAY